MKAFSLGSQFWKYSWKKGKDEKNYLSLKKDIQDILEGKTPLAGNLKKENTPQETTENTPGYFPCNLEGNDPVSTGNTLRDKPKAGQLLPVNIENRKREYPLKRDPSISFLLIFLATHFQR